MRAKNYLDFDILIVKTSSGYRVNVINSPVGQASSEFSLPFSTVELENFALRIGQSRQKMRRIESATMEIVKRFGERLFDSLFADDTKECLQSSLREASHFNTGLRIRLRLSNAPELLDIPWEFLYHSAQNRFLALSVESPIVRYLDQVGQISPLAVTPPLRLLVMIANPSDYVALDVKLEWRLLKQALKDLEERGLLIVDHLRSATLPALQQQLRQADYHIFHFIGHGGFDTHAEDGILLLEDENGKSRAVSGQYLGILLHDAKTMRLAFLNTCEGGRTGSSDPFAGVCQSLLQQGIPAVIAMQFAISDQAAIILAHEFYMGLTDGLPVEAALAEARKSIFAHNNEIEWGTPVLYMRASNGQIFGLEGQTVARSPVTQPPFARQWLQRLLSTKPSSIQARPSLRGRTLPGFSWRQLSVFVGLLIVITIGLWRWFANSSILEPPLQTPTITATTSLTRPEAAAGYTITPIPTLATATSVNIPAIPMNAVPEATLHFTTVFTHTFEDRNPNPWGESGDAIWQVVDDGTGNHVYQVHAAPNVASASDPPEQGVVALWSDYAVEFRLRILQPGQNDNDLYDGWLTIREKPSSAQECLSYNFYFDFGWQEVALSTNDDCTFKRLESESYPFKLNRWYTMRVEAVGTHLRLLINGQVIIESDDSTSSSGFYYLNADHSALLQFDDIRVEQYIP